MYRYLLPAIVVLFWGGHLQAQQFSGKGSITLESQGVQSSTRLSTQQVSGNFDASKEEILFYFKTQSLALRQDQATRAMVSDLFQSSAHPVVKLVISQVSLQDMNKGQFMKNATLNIFGQSFAFPVAISSSGKENGFSLSSNFSIDLSSNQFQLPKSYQDRMGQKLNFQLDQFIINRR